MYTSFTAKNYRSFRDFTIEPLARVNLLAGQNNVGKTALLEAISIYHSGDPSAGLSVNLARGLEELRRDELLWNLFRGFDPTQTITLSGKNAQDEAQVLEITYRERATSRISLGNGQEKDSSKIKSVLGELQAAQSEILFQYRNSSGEASQPLRIFFEGDELRLDRPPGFKKPNLLFLQSRSRENHQAIAQGFSQLRETNNHRQIVEVLQLIENRLNGLEVLLAGNKTMIYGDIGLKRLMPMPLMGEGIGRLLEIALAIVTVPDGLVLIDEIENGLHYSVLGKVWGAIGDLAREYNVQVFATTHDWECIKAAYEAFSESSPDEFLYHRLERTLDGEDVGVVTADAESLGVTFEMYWEIR
jgi:AAA15 family ATPase/GTPase